MNTLTLVPDYAFFTLRDIEAYAAAEAGTALAAARTQIAASTGFEIYVCCAQEVLAVTATVGLTAPDSPEAGWAVIRGLPLESGTGQLQLGDVTGHAAIVHTGLTSHLSVDVYHRGRDQAVDIAARLAEQRGHLSTEEYFDLLAAQGTTEQYHLHVSPARQDT